MKFISIGDSCNIKHQIDTNHIKEETLFFDWLMSDMDSVNIILKNHNNIDDIININKLTIKTKNRSKSKIYFNFLPRMISMHDVKINYNQDDLKEFINKYKRRFNRIIDYIKNYNDKIIFLKYKHINIQQKNDFIKNIKSINTNCNFKLIVFFKNDLQLDNDKYFININLKNYLIKNKKDWKTDQYNWKLIFKNIKNNY